jgi:hypothetical protein
MSRRSTARAQDFDEASPASWLCPFLRARKTYSRRAGLARSSLTAACFSIVCLLGGLFAFREVPAAEFAVPEADELAVRAVLLGDVGTGFGRRAAAEVLVGADVVVEGAELDQPVGQVGALDDDASDCSLEGAETFKANSAAGAPTPAAVRGCIVEAGGGAR